MSLYASSLARLFSGVAVVVAIAAGTGTGHSQPPDGRASYRYLSDRGQTLFDHMANANGLPDDEQEYNALEESKRTTFETIVHALESVGIDELVQSVERIWGAGDSTDGHDMYRLSVRFTEGADTVLRSRPDFDFERFGHVKLPSGDVIGENLISKFADVDAVRQVRTRGQDEASLHLSWKQNNPTVGEIDIDYRRLSDPIHYTAVNSDVRYNAHYRLHATTYGAGLVNWWRTR